jgi:hypothetical protein
VRKVVVLNIEGDELMFENKELEVIQAALEMYRAQKGDSLFVYDEPVSVTEILQKIYKMQ